MLLLVVLFFFLLFSFLYLVLGFSFGLWFFLGPPSPFFGFFFFSHCIILLYFEFYINRSLSPFQKKKSSQLLVKDSFILKKMHLITFTEISASHNNGNQYNSLLLTELFCFKQLTDFGLSKVGLINSTDDLSGPAVSGTTLLGYDEPTMSASEHQQERRKKRSAVGTPDYLAPEILLGTGHG